MGQCPEGDEFFVQLQVRKHTDGTFRIQRLFFEMSDDLWEIYQEKKDAEKAGV